MAVLVTSSAAPAFFSRIGLFHSLADLGKMAGILHAEVVARLHYGMVALQRESDLREGQKRATFRLGSCLVDRSHGTLGSKFRLRAVRSIAQSDLPQLPYVGPLFDRLASIPFPGTE